MSEVKRTRRKKRDKIGPQMEVARSSKPRTTKKAKKKSKALAKHGSDGPSGGVEALLPSIIGLTILVCGVMAKMGFRGRATVAGIDLGTTNSVVCVQAPSKGVGEIDCIKDPLTDSPIIPSVVSFLDPWERQPKTKSSSSNDTPDLDPPPSHFVVGQSAKQRIDTHPRQTFYHAKRVLGRPPNDQAVKELAQEVEFAVVRNNDDDDDNNNQVAFRLNENVVLSPSRVGAHVVHYMMELTKGFLGHDNVKAAVICVPAKFGPSQREATADAFRLAGVTVTRVLEEPVAAALAYGLHLKPNVHHVLVYDFGGGTLDVSLLHVTDGFADVMGNDGDNQLGGADFDAAIAHHLLRTTNTLQTTACPSTQTPLCTLSSLHTISEKIKIELSLYPNGGGRPEFECLTLPENNKQADDLCESLEPVKLALTSDEFDEIVQPLYHRAVEPVRRLLDDLNVAPEEVDEVVMVGGTTRMPQIRKRVQDVMKEAPLNTHIDPDITVAYGAASVID